MSDVWQTLTHTVKGSESTQKTDDWVSWTSNGSETFTEDEIMAHLSSGRFSQRECPDTPGVWELKDNSKVKGFGQDKGNGKRDQSPAKA